MDTRFVEGLMRVELARSGDWPQTLWVPTWAANGNDSGEPGCERMAAESWLLSLWPPGLEVNQDSEAQPLLQLS